MSLAQLVDDARVWLRPVLVGVGVGALLALGVGTQLARFYLSEVTVYVGPPLGAPVANSDILVGQSLRQTFADLSMTQPILERVVATTDSSIDPVDLAGRIEAFVPGNSNLLVLGVRDRDPGHAAVLANALAAELAALVEPGTTPETTSNIDITVVDPAIPPDVAEGPSTVLIAVMGGAIGLISVLALAFIVESVDRSRRNAE